MGNAFRGVEICARTGRRAHEGDSDQPVLGMACAKKKARRGAGLKVL